MITIKKNIRARRLIPVTCEETSFVCPSCGARHSIFTKVVRCRYCSRPMLDVLALMNDKDYSLRYHFNKINDDGSKNLKAEE